MIIKEKWRKYVVCCCDTLGWCQLLSLALVSNADSGWQSGSDRENWEFFFWKSSDYSTHVRSGDWQRPEFAFCNFAWFGPVVAPPSVLLWPECFLILFCVLIAVYLLTLDYFWLLDYCWHRVNSTVPLLSDVVTVMNFLASNSSGSSFFPEIEQIGVNCHSCG